MKKAIFSLAALCLICAALSGCAKDISRPSETRPTETEKHTHVFSEWSVFEEATCTLEGKYERFCQCGLRDTKPIKKKAHTATDWVVDVEPTLRESGKRHMVCTECDSVFNEEVTRITIDRLPPVFDDKQQEYRPSYDLAHCRHREGKPVVLLLFMDDNESSWTEAEVNAFKDEHVTPGLEYLETEAKKWNVELDFNVISYSTPTCGYELKYEGKVNKDLSVGGSTKDIIDKAAEDICFGDNWDLYSYYQNLYPHETVIFLSFFNKDGRSYTRHAISPGQMEYAEHSVIFADLYGSSPQYRAPGSRASAVAHELLHLFGAEDYYASLSRESIANELYPDDILLWCYDDISRNTLGDLTAFSIGWTDEIPQVCYNGDWWK